MPSAPSSYLENQRRLDKEHTHTNAADDPTTVSAIASQQHQQEQEMLLSFTVPEPPVSTKELTLATDSADDPNMHIEAPRTLWMGDLDPLLDKAGIIDLWWMVLGKKVNLKLIKPKILQANPDQASPTHSGYCFVEFQLYEDARLALSLNGQLLPDIAMPSQRPFKDNSDNQKKYFRLNWASGATLTAPIIDSPEYSLFVGDLSASTTEAHLLSFFQKSFPDSIRTVRVMTDPVSGKSRCFGFVRFSNEHERQRALVEMNGAWLGGRPLRVAYATPRSTNSYHLHLDYNLVVPSIVPGSRNSMPDYMYYPGQSVGPLQMPGFYPPRMVPKVGGKQFASAPGQNDVLGPEDPYNSVVFVGGLLSEISESTLYALFQPFGEIQNVKIPPGKNCGFIKYTYREEAEDAIQNMAGFVIGGHRIRLGWGRPSANNWRFNRHHMAQMQMQAAALSMGMDHVPMYNPSGIHPGAPQPGLAHGYPPMPMSMPPQGMMSYQSSEKDGEPGQDYEDSELAENSVQGEDDENPGDPHSPGDLHSHQHIGAEQEGLDSAFKGLSLMNRSSKRSESPPASS